jgi:hypothetical protein
MEDDDHVTGPRGTEGGSGSLKKDFLIAEAKEAVKPFKSDFKRVDWYTIYVSTSRGSRNRKNARN